jgi:hypothetical protein
MSRTHTFEKFQCDRCQHRSAVKNMPPPSLSLPVPIPPLHHTHHPSANCPGPMISRLFDPATSSANARPWCAVPGAKHRNPLRSVPHPSPPPVLPDPSKPSLPLYAKTTATWRPFTATNFFCHNYPCYCLLSCWCWDVIG